MAGPSLNRVRAAPFRDRRDYFHRPTPVAAWKVRLAVLALLVTVGWVAVAVASRSHLRAAMTHGELARSHVPWMNQCDACHVPHGSGGAGDGLFAVRDRWRTFRCETCHAGPANDPKNYGPHYDRTHNPQLVDDAQARDCSSCHHDHRGKDFDLTRVSDSECVRCHRDLSRLHGTGPSITAFATDHPDFRATTHPPTRGLKFNHALHLAKGLTEPANLNNPNAAFKLGQVAAADREKYRRFADGDSEHAVLRLECSACHEPAGGGYKRVVFEQRCQGCHAQTVSFLQSPGGVTTKPFQVEHGRPLAETDRLIRSEILRQIEDQKGILRQVPVPPPDRLDSPRIAVPSDLGKEADALTKMATGLLTCRKCHTIADGQVKPTGTPTLWLPAAKFDHLAHRAIRCADCHETWEDVRIWRNAGPEEGLNVPGIDNCLQCHAPAGSTEITTAVNVERGPAWAQLGLPSPGGIRHDCVDCHHYHRPGHP
jgi:hypothetical protein